MAPRKTKRNITATASSNNEMGSGSPSSPGLACEAGLDSAITTFSRSSSDIECAPVSNSVDICTTRGSSSAGMLLFPLAAAPLPPSFISCCSSALMLMTAALWYRCA